MSRAGAANRRQVTLNDNEMRDGAEEPVLLFFMRNDSIEIMLQI
jgi:hypothetical protein